ncbi:RES family NAD+ phosphorylase [Psychromonas sp. KJ10-10]|uniref:RES family NAD+ phosphorylase n=1 Tax=Psychromonas sp. KJ10-10 TaxID=3391823 RepID=UPI0039B4B6DE
MFSNSYTKISGTFVRICSPDQVALALQRNSPKRPQARYNRHGQDALYLAVNEESACVAMQKYINNIDTPLVLVTYEVEPCFLVDLRHADNKHYRTLTSQDWQTAVNEAREPSSWQVSDLLRKNKEIGLIDPSRKNPEKWHITLFRWNELGAPGVRIVNQPSPIFLN